MALRDSTLGSSGLPAATFNPSAVRARSTGVVAPRSIAAVAPTWTPTRTSRSNAPKATFKRSSGGGSEVEQKPRSLFEQVTDVVKSVPAGVGALVGQIAKTSTAPAWVAKDLASMPFGGGGNLKGILADGLQFSDVGRLNQNYTPLAASMQTSLGQTGYRLTHPGEYANAVREGRIVDAVLEDVGNAALVAGPIGKAIGSTATSTSVSLRAAAALDDIGATTRAASRGLGAAEMASQGGGFTARQLRRAARTAPKSSAPIEMVTDAAGKLVPATREVTLRGRGLAGYIERSGNMPLAKSVEKFGDRVTTAAKLGERIDDAQFSLPARAIAAPVKYAAKKLGIPDLARAQIARAAEGKGAVGGIARSFTETGRRVAGVSGALNAEGTTRTRQALDAARSAKELGLDEPMQRVALNLVDDRFYNIVARYMENGDVWDRPGIGRFDGSTRLEQFIDKEFGDMPPTERPTADDVRNTAAYRRGDLDPEVAKKLDQVAEVQRGTSNQRTERLVGASKLNPEQVGNELMDSVVDAQRSTLERSRDSAQRDVETITRRFAKAERTAAARVAVNRSLPDIPDVEASLQAGVDVGSTRTRASMMRDELEVRQKALEAAVDRYVKLDESTTPDGTVRAAAAEVDRLTRQVDALDQQVRRKNRQYDAQKGLERADSEVQTREAERPGEPPVVRKEVQEEIAVVKQEELDRVNSDRQSFVGPGQDPYQGPTIPNAARAAAGGGQYDHWVFNGGKELGGRASARRKRYEELGYFTREGVEGKNARRQFISLDDWAESVKASNPNMASWSTDQILDAWIKIADRELDMTRGSNSAYIMQRVAERLGVDVATLSEAYHTPGGAKEFRAAVMRDVDDALNDLHAQYRALDEGSLKIVDEMIEDVRAHPDEFDSASDVFEMIDGYINGSGGRGGLYDRLGQNGVTVEQALQFMRDGVVTEDFHVAVQRAPTVAQRVQRAGTQGEAKAARQRLSDAMRSSKAARKTYDQATVAADLRLSEAATDVERAAAAVDQTEAQFYEAADDSIDAADRAADIQEAATYDEVVVDKDGNERTVTRKPYKRTKGRDAEGNVTNPLSPAERWLSEEGVLTERAGRLATEKRRAQRRFDNWNNKIEGLRSKLARSWQDRMVDEVNAPAVNGMRRLIRNIAPDFGTFIDGELGPDGSMLTPPRVSGVMGQVAHKYDFMDELAKRMFDLRKSGDYSAMSKAAAFYEVVDDMGLTFDGPTQTLLDDSWQTTYLLDSIRDIEDLNAREGHRLNTPYRVIDLIQQQQWIPKKLPDDVGSQLAARAEAFQRRRANYVGRLMDDQLRAVPARYRAPLINARRDVATMLDMAEEYNKNHAGSGDPFLRMAEDSVTTLADLVEAGVDPTHLIGGKVLDRPGGANFSSGSLAQRKLMAEHELATGLRAMDPSVYARTEAAEAITMLKNDSAKVIGAQFGQEARSIIGVEMAAHLERTGRPMPADQMKALIDDAGYAPLEGTNVESGAVTVVPKAVIDEMRQWNTPREGAWATLNGINRAFKTAVLPFSIRWHVGNVVGNALMSVAYGGMGPIELAKTMNQVAAMQGGWKAALKGEGLPRWAPDELANHGLSYGEHQMMWQGLTPEMAASRTQRLIAESFHVNEFFDNMFRSSVYLSQLKKGVPTELALKNTLNALGDYTRMTSFERRVVREVLPFYAWIRHQTQAAMRMPLNSPGRAAYMYSLGNIFADDEMSPEALALLGSRIPLGGDRYLNAGSLNPFASPLSIPLDPSGTDFMRSISPAIGLPTKVIGGIDIDKRRGITRPSDTAERGVYGEELTTSPVRRITSGGGLLAGLAEAAYVTAGEIPFVNQARNLALPGNRFDTGQLRPTQYQNRPRSLLTETVPSLLMLPQYQSNLDEDIARVDELNGNRVRRPSIARAVQGG